MKTAPVVAPTFAAITILASTAVAYLATGHPFATVSSKALLHMGAVNGELLHQGEFWRLITSQFVHQKQLHMLFNVLAGLVVGTTLERTAGRLRFALVYWIGGTLGILASVGFAPQVVSSGASQALMAVCAAVIFLKVARKVPVSASVFTLACAATVISMTLDIYSVGSIKPGHLAGFLAGILLTLKKSSTFSLTN